MNKTIVKCACPFCDKISYVEVDSDKYGEWIKTNRPVQEVFPELSVTEKELLISGICEECQNGIFGSEFEEDDYDDDEDEYEDDEI